MKTQRLGESDLVSSRLAYGCMRIAGTWNPSEITETMCENAKKCVLAAFEAGYLLFDHADIYCRGECESLHGKVMRDVPSMRAQTLIATKCGVRRKDDPPGAVGRYDFSYGHILSSCEGSLNRLGVETIDLYQLHRPDVLMNPEEVARAFTKLKDDGKVRFFGVSNFIPSFVDTLQRALSFKLVSNQIEASLVRREPFFDGTLDHCIRENLTPLAWSPLGGLGAEREGDEFRKRLTPVLSRMDNELGVGSAAISLAWLLKHPSGIVPIVGSANPTRIRHLAEVVDTFELSREDWYELLVAAQGYPMP